MAELIESRGPFEGASAIDDDNEISRATVKPMLFSESGTVGGPVVGGFVAGDDPADFFKFVATQDGTLEINVTNLDGDVYVNVYDENGVKVGVNANIRTTSKLLLMNVDAGRTYYIEMEPRYGSGTIEYEPITYDLQTAFRPFVTRPDDNNSFEDAAVWTVNQFSNGSSFISRGSDGSGAVGGPGDNADFFTIVPQSKTILSIELTNLGGDFDTKVYDSNRTLIAESNVDGVAPERVNVQLDSGQRYYIEVSSPSGARGEYRISAVHGDEDDFIETAREVDFFDIPSNNLRWSDPQDYVTFVAHETGVATVRLSGLTKDYNLEVYDSDRNLIDRSDQPSTIIDSVSFGVVGGQRYYLKVESAGPFDFFRGGNAYNLDGSFQLQPDDGNDTRDAAQSLETPSLTSSQVGGNDEGDFYSFVAPENGRADLTLSGFSANADLRVYNSDGELLAAAASTSSDQEALSVAVTNGETYFVRVNTTRASLTDYDLRLSFASRSFDSEAEVPSDTTTDRSLVLGETIDGEIEQARDSDWYAITVPENSVYVVRAETADGSTLANPDMVLRSASGNFVAQDTDDDGEAAEFVLSEPGTYYLDVRSYSGDTGAYTLTARSQFVQNERPGSSSDVLGSVESDAVLIFGEAISGRLETPLDSDWFQVSVTDNDSVTIELAGSGSNAGTLSEGTLVLRSENGDFVEQVSGGAGENTVITIANPGTYWVDVRSHNNLSGSYQLTATSSTASDSDNSGTPIGSDVAGDATTSIQLFPGSNRTQALENTSDSDWYKIVNLQGDTLTVTISGSGADALTDPDLVLRRVSGDFVNQDVGRPGEDVVFELSATGTFYLDVRSYSGSTGSYSISVDDNANAASSSALIQTDNLAT